jgi:hypothetical protein
MRDLPLLKRICTAIEADPEGRVVTTELPSLIAMPEADIAKGVRALEGEYVTVEWRSHHPVFATPDSRDYGVIVGIHAAARRAVGMWPTAESVTERLLATLDEQIESSADHDKRNKLIKIRDTIGGTARDLFVDIVGSVVAKTVTGS